MAEVRGMAFLPHSELSKPSLTVRGQEDASASAPVNVDLSSVSKSGPDT